MTAAHPTTYLRSTVRRRSELVPHRSRDGLACHCPWLSWLQARPQCGARGGQYLQHRCGHEGIVTRCSPNKRHRNGHVALAAPGSIHLQTVHRALTDREADTTGRGAPGGAVVITGDQRESFGTGTSVDSEEGVEVAAAQVDLR